MEISLHLYNRYTFGTGGTLEINIIMDSELATMNEKSSTDLEIMNDEN